MSSESKIIDKINSTLSKHEILQQLSRIRKIEDVKFSLRHSQISFVTFKTYDHLRFEMKTESKDYLIFSIYPLIVLGTNRICDTAISRKKNIGRIRYFDDLRNIRGMSSLYAGFLPFAINYIRLYILPKCNMYKKMDDFYYMAPEKMDVLWKIRNMIIVQYILS